MEVARSPQPLDVTAAKAVTLALVTYLDEYGSETTQLCVVGENNVNLLDSAAVGFSRTRTPSGPASKKIKAGILQLLRGQK